MLDFKLICVNILSRETCFLCLRGPSPLYGSTIVGFSRCPAAMYFKAALCSLLIVIRISELRVWVCVVLCRAEQVFRLRDMGVSLDAKSNVTCAIHVGGISH